MNRNWKTVMLCLVLTVSKPQRLYARAAFTHGRTGQLLRSSSTRAMSSSTASEDSFEVYRNKNNSRDQIFSAISGDGGIKVTVATIRNAINDASIQNTMTAVPTDALGRAMACGLLIANGMQAEQTVQITMKGTFVDACFAQRESYFPIDNSVRHIDFRGRPFTRSCSHCHGSRDSQRVCW